MRKHLGLAALAAGCASIALLGPTARAEGPQWSGSVITSPSSGSNATVDIRGQFQNADWHIRDVEIRFGRPDFDDADADACVPDDLPSVEDGDGDPGPPNEVYRFDVNGVTFDCNGRYAVQAIASAAGPINPSAERSHVLTRAFDIAVPPVPVPSMTATLAAEEQPDTATADDPAPVVVTWEQIDGSQYPDFLGYRIQRTGPGDTGTTNVSGTLAPGTSTYTDQVEAPGHYTYSVESLRSGPNDDVPSGTGTPTDEVRVAGPKATTSTPTANDDNNDGDGGGSGVTQPPDTSRLTIPEARAGARSPRSRSGITVPRTPGTIDTGFDEELDYGERPGDSEPGDENALAGEGQSIIRSDEAGPGLLGPVAGALVLLGWAGHVAYLNRLARQF